MSKIEVLNKLKEEVKLTVKNIDNYPKGELNVIVANHNCLMDIFYLPMSLPEDIVSLVSARLVYKKEEDRQDIINKYLYAMPIEAHGGSMYSKMCLEQAKEILLNCCSVAIFPEGAYVQDNKIFKGHTGAARIIYDTCEAGSKVNLVPVSIGVARNDDLDNYKKIDDEVMVTVLPPVDYEESYYNFIYSQNRDEKNKYLHKPLDTAMKMIANELGLQYEDSCIPLRNKGNVMFSDGSVVDTNVAQADEYIKRYENELITRRKELVKIMTMK